MEVIMKKLKLNLSSAKQEMATAVQLAEKCKAGTPAHYTDLPTLLYPFLNLAPDDKLLYLSWLVYTLISSRERYPQILLALEGPHGCGKTELCDFTGNYLQHLRKIFKSDAKVEVNFFSPRTVTSDKILVHDGHDTPEGIVDAGQHIIDCFDEGYKAAVINGIKVDITDPLLTDRTLKLTMPPLQKSLPLKDLYAKYDLVLGAIYAIFPQFMLQMYMAGPTENQITSTSKKRLTMGGYELIGRKISILLYNDENRFLDRYMKTQIQEVQDMTGQKP